MALRWSEIRANVSVVWRSLYRGLCSHLQPLLCRCLELCLLGCSHPREATQFHSGFESGKEEGQAKGRAFGPLAQGPSGKAAVQAAGGQIFHLLSQQAAPRPRQMGSIFRSLHVWPYVSCDFILKVLFTSETGEKPRN